MAVNKNGGGSGKAGYDISGSTSSSAASKQTTASKNTFEVGRLTFGAKKNNTPLYILSGVVGLFILFKVLK